MKNTQKTFKQDENKRIPLKYKRKNDKHSMGRNRSSNIYNRIAI